jgi:hypothetical protein
MGTTIKPLRPTPRATAWAPGSINYLHGAAIISLDTTIKHLRRTTSTAAGSGLVATMNYLRRTTSGAAGNGLGTTINTCDAQGEAPREVAYLKRSSTCDVQ